MLEEDGSHSTPRLHLYSWIWGRDLPEQGNNTKEMRKMGDKMERGRIREEEKGTGKGNQGSTLALPPKSGAVGDAK